MEKDEKPVWSTDDIRSHCNDWSLAADAALFEHIQSLSQNILERTQSVLDSVDSLGNSLNITATSISNTGDKFLSLANSQFVENRVYEDEDVALTDSNVPAQTKPSEDKRELSSILEDAFSRGINLVDTKFSEFQLPGSDSDDEDLSSPSRLVLRPQNPYSSRLLPHLIGSAEFFKDDKVGLSSALCSSESSSSSSLCEEDEEDSSPELKPYMSRASLSSGSVESLQSMEDLKSASPADDMFGRYRDSINSVGKLQASESKLSDQLYHPETVNQHSKQRNQPGPNEQVSQEPAKPSNTDTFNHHMISAPSLFSPPPFNGEESSEESDDESLFAGRKQNHKLFIDDDDEDEEDDVQVVQNGNQKIKNPGNKNVLNKSEPQENNSLNQPISKEPVPQKKLPAGAVSIFGRNMNPFPSGPPLFPRDEDSEDESEPTQGTSSDDGFSASYRSSSDFGYSKPDPPTSKATAPAKKALFDDDDEDESSKDFDSLLFKSSLFPTKNAADSSKKPLSDLFADSTEDIFSSSKNKTKPSSRPSVSNTPDKQSTSEESTNSKKISFSDDKLPNSDKQAEKLDVGNPKGAFSKSIAKPVSSSLFNSDDDLFSSISNKVDKSVTKSEGPPRKENLFDDSDSVDFTVSASPSVKKVDTSTKRPFLDLFDDNEDDDSFLFGSNLSNKKTISASDKGTPKLASVKDNVKNGGSNKDDDLFSKSEKVSITENLFERSNPPSIFDDEDESSMFTESTKNKIETEISSSRSFSAGDASSSTEKRGTASTVIDPLKSGAFEDELFGESKQELKSDAVVPEVTSQIKTPMKPIAGAVQGDALGSKIHDNGSGDAKKLPIIPTKPAAGALSEIDKLKRKLASSGSDDFSSDDSSANSKPKVPNPGKLAANRGQNINIAALIPGYKHRSMQKSESSTLSSESLSNSESAPVFMENSSHLPVESAIVEKPVPKSTSLPISFASNDSSPVEQTDTAFLEESSTYSHFLANDAMKKRARLSIKRRPPSQKARQEAARTSVSNDTFSSLAVNSEISTNESIVRNDPPIVGVSKSSLSSEIVEKHRSAENSVISGSKSASPLGIRPNDLFSDIAEDFSDVLPEKSLFVGDSPSLSTKELPPESVPSIASDSPRFNVESDDLFGERDSSEKSPVSDPTLKNSPSSAAEFVQNQMASKSVSSIFATRPPPLNLESDDLFGENITKKFKEESAVPDPASEKPSKSISSIFDDSPPPLETDNLFSVEKSPEDMSQSSFKNENSSSKKPENTKEKLTNTDSLVSSIFNDTVTSYNLDSNDLFSDALSEQSASKPTSESHTTEKSMENFSNTTKDKSDELASVSSKFNSGVSSRGIETADLFNDSPIKVPKPVTSINVNADKEDHLFSSPSSKKKVPKFLADNTKALSEPIADLGNKKSVSGSTKVSAESKSTPSNPKSDPMKKSAFTAENPLVEDFSDEDLFGSYTTKPAISVLNKFKPSDSKQNSSQPKKNLLTNSKSEVKPEENFFFETDNNIEKLFPKVKIGAKKSSQIDPLSEVSQDSEEEDLFDVSVLSPSNEEKQKPDLSSQRDKTSFKPAESLDDSSVLEESFKTVPSVQSDLDKTGDLITSDEVVNYLAKSDEPSASLEEKTQKREEKMVGQSSVLDDDVAVDTSSRNSKMSAPLFHEKEDLFQETPQAKVHTLPSKNPATKMSKHTDLFGDDDEDDGLFWSTPKSTPKTPSSNASFKTNPSSKSTPPSSSATSNVSSGKKKEPSREAVKAQKLFDDEDDHEDLFNATKVKPQKAKAVDPPKKKLPVLPKLNTSSIFGDDEDSDTELFASSLKKK